MKRLYWLLALLVMGSAVLKAQQVLHFQVDQAPKLSVSLSPQNPMCAGTKLNLGEHIEVKNPVGEVIYYWFPADKVSDPTVPNPVARVTETTKFRVRVQDSRGCAAEAEITVQAALCDALTGQTQTGLINVYPNPAQDLVFVDLVNGRLADQAQLKLVDALGQTVLEKNFLGMQQQTHLSFHVDGLAAGVYYVRLVSGNTLYVKRIQIN